MTASPFKFASLFSQFSMEPQGSDLAVAHFMGVLASLCFTLQYSPQFFMNWKKKSVKGFSSSSIIIKLVGACFLFVNVVVTGEARVVQVYGLFNVCQHLFFIVQFQLYKPDEDKRNFLYFFFLPAVPYLLWWYFPSSVEFTNMLKPAAQVASHVPQVATCWRNKSTSGLAMNTQHLNFIGGVAGMYMCYVIPPISWTTYAVYVNSCLQALSLYGLYFYFDRKGANRNVFSMHPAMKVHGSSADLPMLDTIDSETATKPHHHSAAHQHSNVVNVNPNPLIQIEE
eukprot:TRINITY_DN5735_c0_g1_i1.p1 TRINITY_DN5735_c0_g1~~TRINITY_DN5735_c0_g1_i1.p1  ORF type:complete len:283 (+),score=33.86 TRINITY_DN5735_c0_g1_i1:166-1014(+)